MNKVYVTGRGMCCPLGITVVQSWMNLLNQKSGLKFLQEKHLKFQTNCKVGGYLHQDYYDKKIYKKYQTSLGNHENNIYSLVHYIVDQAVQDCPVLKSYLDKQKNQFNKIGCIVANQFAVQHTQNYDNSNKLIFVKEKPHIVSSSIAMKYGLNGYISAPSLSFGGGLQALQQGYHLIKYGIQDAVIVVGADFNLDKTLLQGMDQLGALAKFDESKQDPSWYMRPFCQNRRGTVLSDGGGAIILMSDKFWKDNYTQGTKPYCEITGFGMTCDANHLFSPLKDGKGLQNSIQLALKESQIQISDIDIINCHATSTPIGDKCEAEALVQILKKGTPKSKRTLITANKGNIGHMGAGAAITESIFAIESFRTKLVPAIKNIRDYDKNESDDLLINNGLDYVTQTEEQFQANYILKNSLSFGGINMSIVQLVNQKDIWSKEENLEETVILQKPKIYGLNEVGFIKEGIQNFLIQLETKEQQVDFQLKSIENFEEQIQIKKKIIQNFMYQRSQTSKQPIFRSQLRNSLTITGNFDTNQLQQKFYNTAEFQTLQTNNNKLQRRESILNNFTQVSQIPKTLNSLILNNFEVNQRQPSMQFISNNRENMDQVQELLLQYNNYITESKKQVLQIIVSLEFDKYLIEKLRKLDQIEDVEEHDRKTFQTIVDHYKPLEEKNNNQNQQKNIYFKNKLNSLKNDIIDLKQKINEEQLEGKNNKDLTKFYFEQYQKNFCWPVSYFCLLFIKQLEDFNKKYEQYNNYYLVKESMFNNFNQLRTRIDGYLNYFNKKFYQFLLRIFKKTQNNAKDYVYIKNNQIRIKQEYIQEKVKEFNEFYFDISQDTLNLVKPEYFKFVAQLSPYYYSIDVQKLQKYKHISLVKIQTIKSYHQKIFIVTLMFLAVKLYMQLSLNEKRRQYYQMILDNFFTYQEVYNVFGVEKFTYFSHLKRNYFYDLQQPIKEQKKSVNKFDQNEIFSIFDDYIADFDEKFNKESNKLREFNTCNQKLQQLCQILDSIQEDKDLELNKNEFSFFFKLRMLITISKQVTQFYESVNLLQQIDQFLQINKKMLQNGNKNNQSNHQENLNLLESKLNHLDFKHTFKSKFIKKEFQNKVLEFQQKLQNKVQILGRVYFKLHLISNDISSIFQQTIKVQKNTQINIYEKLIDKQKLNDLLYNFEFNYYEQTYIDKQIKKYLKVPFKDIQHQFLLFGPK